LILVQFLLIFRCGLLHGCKFLLQLAILRGRRDSYCQHCHTNNHQAFTDRDDSPGYGLLPVRDCNTTNHFELSFAEPKSIRCSDRGGDQSLRPPETPLELPLRAASG
jgi:hypothetical protein